MLHKDLLWTGVGLVFFSIDQKLLRKLVLPKTEFWKIITFFRQNKPGTAQVGAIFKAQKDSKTTFSTTGDNKSSQKTKN